MSDFHQKVELLFYTPGQVKPFEVKSVWHVPRVDDWLSMNGMWYKVMNIGWLMDSVHIQRPIQVNVGLGFGKEIQSDY